jgi:hypothetical protein
VNLWNVEIADRRGRHYLAARAVTDPNFEASMFGEMRFANLV